MLHENTFDKQQTKKGQLMTKISYKLLEHDGRYYFNDGTGYFLIDTGFGYHSISPDGKIGPFDTDAKAFGDERASSEFLRMFMGPSRPDGQNVKGILAPMEGYSILLKGDTVTIDDDAKELPTHDYFIPFISDIRPIIEGKCNGKNMRFFFDSGMRMAVMDDSVLNEGKQCLGTINEWIAPLGCAADAPYYSAEYEFAGGLRFNGQGEFDYSDTFLKRIRHAFNNEFDAFFGIEFFRQYDLFISLIPGKRGLAIIDRGGRENKEKTGVRKNVVQAPFSREEQLRRICQDTNDERRKAIERELLSMGIVYRVLDDGTLVIPARHHDRQGTVAVCAHYDVVPGSKGYNDNGMSIVIVLGMLNALPGNVEVVFTNGEEYGQTGAREYLKYANHMLKVCINLDVCGCYDDVYLDPMNCPEAKKLSGCKKGRMPHSDACIFRDNGIPSVCFSTGKADVDFQTGIRFICSTLHNGPMDNDFSLLNFEMIPKVQDKVIELIGMING